MGLTQEDLADASGLSKSDLSLIEQGELIPSMSQLNKLIEALSIDISELLSDTESPQPKSSPGSTIPLRAISGSVGRERRAPWHPEARKNQFLKMAAYILECDHPELTPEFEKKILEVHTALLAPGACEPGAPKKVESA